MTLFRTIRRLRACLLALFVTAQIAGVVPLIYDHTLNVFETTPVAGHTHVHVATSIVARDGDHHHGMLDLHDQCCALHTLAAPLPLALGAAPVDFAGTRLLPATAMARPQDSPVVPDRPPKAQPAI